MPTPINLDISDSETLAECAASPEGGRARALANWDPSYPGEKIDFYQEYIHRHAPITMRWLQTACDSSGHVKQDREALGMGLLGDGSGGSAHKAVAFLDDGSVCMWDLTQDQDLSGDVRRGRIIARSVPALISTSTRSARNFVKSITNETGAVDNVSVNSSQQKAYIALFDQLNEVDLQTLQVISRQTFPFPITALSEARHSTPLTVGTNMTLHLHDTRAHQPLTGTSFSSRCELIGGTPLNNDLTRSFLRRTPSAHTTLAQPGPLSILHLPTPSSLTEPSNQIWIAGRFTSLLTYDRRFWPRIHSTLFSGAKLSALTYLPFPYVARPSSLSNPDQLSTRDLATAKSLPGGTLIAAGQYKGKGSLELYGLSPQQPGGNQAIYRNHALYRNRQTASKSRLLSVCPHGSRIVFSDGDGLLKWVERDGVTEVRRFNINEDAASTGAADGDDTQQHRSIFATTAPPDPGPGDIVQKIVTTRGVDTSKNDDLIVWTGDGRLGIVNHGHDPSLSSDEVVEDAVSDEESSKIREERQYGLTMRKALEQHANEARFVRGLGFIGPPRSWQ